MQGELQLFDDPEVLDYPWTLSDYDADPTPATWKRWGWGIASAEGGTIDVDGGEVASDVGSSPSCSATWVVLHAGALGRSTRLSTWLAATCRKAGITHSQQTGIRCCMAATLCMDPTVVWRAQPAKVSRAQPARSTHPRVAREAVKQAYQQTLCSATRQSERVVVGDDFRSYSIRKVLRAESRLRSARGRTAYWISATLLRTHRRFRQQGRIRVRVQLDTLAQQDASSFGYAIWSIRRAARSSCKRPRDGSIRTSSASCNDGTVLVVEYKGAQGWTDAEDDREIGELWASLSNGRCRFVMVRDKRWEQIEACLE